MSEKQLPIEVRELDSVATGTAYIYSRCAHPDTCPRRDDDLHKHGIHDAVKIENIGS